MKRALKIFFKSLAALLLLIVLLAASLYLPPVQRWAVKKLTTYLEEQTGLEVSIGSVHLSPLLDLSLGQVHIAKPPTDVIDVEHALDPVYAAALGVNIDELLVSQPDTGEDALEIAEALVRSGAIDIIVVDSVAALAPKAEIEGDMGAAHVGLQARLMSQALRKLAGSISKLNCVAIFINQLREKVGVMFGNPETTPGGRALKFYASVRIDIRKIDTLKVGGEVVGSRTRAKVVKNKIAPPFREAEFDIMYGQGISRIGELLDLAVQLDIVKKSGAWFSYGENRIGQGRDNVKEYLRSNPDVAQQIEEELMSQKERLSFSRQTAKKSKAAKAAAEEAPAADGARPATAPAESVPADAKPNSSRTSGSDIDILVD